MGLLCDSWMSLSQRFLSGYHTQSLHYPTDCINVVPGTAQQKGMRGFIRLAN